MQARAAAVSSFPLSFEQNFSQCSERHLRICESPQIPPMGVTGVGGQMEKGCRSLSLSSSRATLLLSVLYIGVPYNIFLKKGLHTEKLKITHSFIKHLLCIDLAGGTGDTAVKQIDRNPKRLLWLLPGE